jgi:hypothetical protein
MTGLAFAAVLVLCGTGCGGISASKSVSPLDFLLPGLMKADPPAQPSTEPAPQLAPEVTILAQAN